MDHTIAKRFNWDSDDLITEFHTFKQYSFVGHLPYWIVFWVWVLFGFPYYDTLCIRIPSVLGYSCTRIPSLLGCILGLGLGLGFVWVSV